MDNRQFDWMAFLAVAFFCIAVTLFLSWFVNTYTDEWFKERYSGTVTRF